MKHHSKHVTGHAGEPNGKVEVDNFDIAADDELPVCLEVRDDSGNRGPRLATVWLTTEQALAVAKALTEAAS